MISTPTKANKLSTVHNASFLELIGFPMFVDIQDHGNYDDTFDKNFNKNQYNWYEHSFSCI